MPPDPLLLFICAHNACRSAIAEVIAADEVARRGLSLKVASAGTHALSGYGAATIAQTTMHEVGLSLEHHRSQPANAEIMSRATLVITMTDPQRDMLHAAFPAEREKIISFNDLTGLGDIDDPVSGDAAEVRTLRDQLQSAMPLVFHELKQRGATR